MSNTLIGIIPLKDWVFVDIYDDGGTVKMIGNQKLWLPSDTSVARQGESHTERHRGIRGRWALVVATNDKAEANGIQVGQKVFLDELKWTRAFDYDAASKDPKKAWAIKYSDIILHDTEGFSSDELKLLRERYGNRVK